jgi:YidC/Oxa1 family membrane protein insertase
MDNLRVFLWAALASLIWITAQTWQKDYGSKPPDLPAIAAESSTKTPAVDQGLPDLVVEGDDINKSASAKLPVADTSAQYEIAPSILVKTDVLELSISTEGGTLASALLPMYPKHKDEPDVPVQLLSELPGEYYVLRSGIRAAEDRAEANHTVRFSTEQSTYVLADGDDEIEIPLRWQSEDGVVVEKIYRLRRGQYRIDLEQTIRNNSKESYHAASYLQLLRRHNPVERSMFDVDSYSVVGPVIYDGEKYEKLDVDDLAEAPFTQQLSGGWIASIQHHFLTAAVPPADSTERYQVSYADGRYMMTTISPLETIAPGESLTIPARFYIGPKLQSQLEDVADNLSLTVDYGLLAILAQPLFWLLEKVHSYIGNWGWSIILVTFMIKMVFYKLTEASGRSMAKMRKLQPRLKALQERYKEDRPALSQAMMDLYKREKVNPAAGCLPMLIQIPFFIAFYWVLLESVETRQAPFMLWITDLSSRDPYFILPLLMGAAMFVQQKLNPAPPDPIQAKVMQFLPVMFTVFFAFFPAGLVLYWLTNSLLSIAQQWRINKVVNA